MEQGPGYSKGDVKYDIHPIIIAPPPPPPPPSIPRLNIQPAKLSCFALNSSVYRCVLSAGQDRQEDWDAAKCPPASLAGRREVTGQIRMT